MLHLLRASAGAGKTHQLVQIYLEHILVNPAHIPQMIVLSFTNKATKELKERIVAHLQNLTKGTSTMAFDLQKKLGYDEKTLKLHAKKALDYLLVHYHDFAVYTIDTFFQNMLRSFSYELQIPATYQLLLEQNQLLGKCTQTLLQQLPHTPALQKTLTELAIQKVQEGKTWHLNKTLTQWGADLLKDFNEPSSGNNLTQKYHEQGFQTLQKLEKEATTFVNTLAEKATILLNKISESNLQTSDFAWGEKGVIGYLKKIKTKGKVVPPSNRIIQASQKPASWLSRKSPQYTQAQLFVTERH